MNDSIAQYIKENLKEADDIRHREIALQRGKLTVSFLEPIASKSDIAEFIIKPIMQNDADIYTLQYVMEKVINISVVEMQTTPAEAMGKLLAGWAIISCDFDGGALCCHTSNFPTRDIPKPDTDPSIKGPQEGFTEFLENNISLIRKRIRNEDLVIESFKVGFASQTPVALIYLKEAAPKELIDQVRSKIQNCKANFVLETNYIEEEFIMKFSFFEVVGNYEKPDIVCSNLFEGRAAILVEGSPSVSVVPTFFVENFIAPDDYFTNRFAATGLRLFRYFSFAITVLLPGLYLALSTYHHSLIPTVILFKLAATRAGVPFPIVLEVVIMLMFFELSREAGRRLPPSIGNTLSLVATLIFGETAVQAGIASAGTIVIIGVYAITSLINPKLIIPTIYLTIINILLSAIFGLHGFFMFFVLMISHLASLESCGYPYMYPLGTVRKMKYRYKDLFVRSKLRRLSYKTLKGNEKQQ